MWRIARNPSPHQWHSSICCMFWGANRPVVHLRFDSCTLPISVNLKGLSCRNTRSLKNAAILRAFRFMKHLRVKVQHDTRTNSSYTPLNCPCPIWLTGRPGRRTMEMIGGSSVSYLARTPCVPLFSLCLIGVETEGLLDHQGRVGIISIVRWNLRPVIFGVESATGFRRSKPPATPYRGVRDGVRQGPLVGDIAATPLRQPQNSERAATGSRGDRRAPFERALCSSWYLCIAWPFLGLVIAHFNSLGAQAKERKGGGRRHGREAWGG